MEGSPAVGGGLRLRDGWLDLSVPRVMGIVNVTPDSFSDGGRYLSAPDAVAHGLALVAEGAHLLDIGGESTRPGAEPVPAAVQIERVVPVLRGLREATAVPLSVDTMSAEVAAAALDAGAALVNDVSAGRADAALLPLVAERGAAVVLMHMRGVPRTMQREVHYDDVVEEVVSHLARRVDAARRAGVRPDAIAVDPGLGFGKRMEHNLALIRHIGRLRALGCPVLVGPSRKRFLGTLTGREASRRVAATVAAVTALVLEGAQIVRVHDVSAARDAVRVAAAIRGTVPETNGSPEAAG